MACAAAALPASLCGCVNQHPELEEGGSPKLVMTSPAGLHIADKLELDLIGIPTTTSDVPERYANVTQVGTAMAPDLELLASMHPTCVISPNTLQSDLQPKYAGIHVGCIFLDLTSVAGLYDSIDYLGRKFDREEQAAAQRAEYEQFMRAYNATISDSTAPRVLVLMGVPGSYMVATENCYAGSLVQMAGAENVYAGTTEEFLDANTEDMLSRDPDIILRTAHALPDDVRQMFAQEFETNDIWKHFRAVQEGRVYDLTYSNFGMSATFSYPDALNELRTYLYESA
ncbi:ABC transporter substrate-binding protein [Denitrobacterium detoxificans]|uniref:heme ABC transporter substrate-binding protein IsdE n=1 Tax=Denitrobacterium detoxificans TaxID=79604 RepID=UPI0007C9B10F|nr:heme ABC transporter substrate-binding protein IsdE [Denitrobacterium detoxificans]ANE23532.1 ABC transporter substrate-binding protein [Denitrobacterium detoxificans]